jgi:chromosome segregation ATPase
MSQQVTAMAYELNNLREVCASQKTEIGNLYLENEFYAKDNKALREVIECYEHKISKRDQDNLDLNVQLDSWKMDCELYRADLIKMRQENEDLKEKNDADNQRICSVEEKLSRRDAQITKLIAILRRKIATNRVMQTALKAAYKILPSLEQQVTYARILDMAKRAPNKVGINQEVSDALKEAGLMVQWDKQSLQSPVQILENKSVQTIHNEPVQTVNSEPEIEINEPPAASPSRALDNKMDIGTNEEPQKHQLLDTSSVHILNNKMDIITDEDVQKLQLLAAA